MDELRDVKTICLEITNNDNNVWDRYGTLRIDEVVEILEETMMLKHSDVVVFRRFRSKRVDVGLKSDAFWSRYVQECMGVSVRISSGHVVSVNLPNRNAFIDVFAKGAPFEWGASRYERILGWYGEVKNIAFLTLKPEDTNKREYLQKEIGTVKIKMKIRKTIPSSLTVDRDRVEFFLQRSAKNLLDLWQRAY